MHKGGFGAFLCQLKQAVPCADDYGFASDAIPSHPNDKLEIQVLELWLSVYRHRTTRIIRCLYQVPCVL